MTTRFFGSHWLREVTHRRRFLFRRFAHRRKSTQGPGFRASSLSMAASEPVCGRHLAALDLIAIRGELGAIFRRRDLPVSSSAPRPDTDHSRRVDRRSPLVTLSISIVVPSGCRSVIRPSCRLPHGFASFKWLERKFQRGDVADFHREHQRVGGEHPADVFAVVEHDARRVKLQAIEIVGGLRERFRLHLDRSYAGDQVEVIRAARPSPCPIPLPGVGDS